MKKHTHLERTLIVGSGSTVVALLGEIKRRPQCRYQIIGIVAADSAFKHTDLGFAQLGSAKDLHEVIQTQQPQVIIVAAPESSSGVLDSQLLEASISKNIRIEHADLVYEQLTGKMPIGSLSAENLIFATRFKPSRAALLSTRVLSLIIAVIGIVVFSPLMLLISIIIKLDSRGPAFFTQQRMGYAGKSFKLVKFRTMSVSQAQTSEWEGDNAHRITRAGKFLRKYRLDEIPQFINVFKGEMNMVGPRPHPTSNFEMFILVSRNTPENGCQIPYYTLRSTVRPGITGWAQVRYRYANNIAEEMEKLQFDLYYLKHYSFWLDIRILFLTLKTVVLGHEIAAPESVEPIPKSDYSSVAPKKPLRTPVSTH